MLGPSWKGVPGELKAFPLPSLPLCFVSEVEDVNVCLPAPITRLPRFDGVLSFWNRTPEMVFIP